MIDSTTYLFAHEVERRRRAAATPRGSNRHRGLQRSAREISLAVRRQRRHGEAA